MVVQRVELISGNAPRFSLLFWATIHLSESLDNQEDAVKCSWTFLWPPKPRWKMQSGEISQTLIRCRFFAQKFPPCADWRCRFFRRIYYENACIVYKGCTNTIKDRHRQTLSHKIRKIRTFCDAFLCIFKHFNPIIVYMATVQL